MQMQGTLLFLKNINVVCASDLGLNDTVSFLYGGVVLCHGVLKLT